MPPTFPRKLKLTTEQIQNIAHILKEMPACAEQIKANPPESFEELKAVPCVSALIGWTEPLVEAFPGINSEDLEEILIATNVPQEIIDDVLIAKEAHGGKFSSVDQVLAIPSVKSAMDKAKALKAIYDITH